LKENVHQNNTRTTDDDILMKDIITFKPSRVIINNLTNSSINKTQ